MSESTRGSGRLSGARVVVVADFDSFLRAGCYYAQTLAAHGAEVSYKVAFARQGQLSPAQLAASGLSAGQVSVEKLGQLAGDPYLHDADLILLALNGMRTRRFTADFYRHLAPGRRRRALLVSFYPGILFRFHLEGMMSRSSSDLFLLNSPADLELYREAMTQMGQDPANGLLMGLPMLPPTRRDERATREGGDLLFIGQPTVPSGRMERAYTVARLAELARRHPQRRVVIKPRHRPGETTLHRMKFHYEDLMRELGDACPPNLVASYDPMPTLLDAAALVVTYSSTAAIEAAVRGIPTRVLTDLGIHENIGNHFFLGAGIFASFDELRPDLEAHFDAAWAARHVCSAADHHERLVGACLDRLATQRTSDTPLPRPNPGLFSRSLAYERHVSREYGPASLPEFGHRNAAETQLQRARRRLRGLGRGLKMVGGLGSMRRGEGG